MSAPSAYRGSITREQWLVNEMRCVARLRADSGISDMRELIAYVRQNNPFQYSTEREVASIARACARRLDAASKDPGIRNRIIGLIAHGTPDQLRQANLYALMCDNRLVWDFMACVLQPKFQTLDPSLTPHEIDAFLDGLRSQDEAVASWSTATMGKIRQVLTKCIAECGIYDRKAKEIKPIYLDFELEQAIRDNGDAAILPAFGIMG